MPLIRLILIAILIAVAVAIGSIIIGSILVLLKVTLAIEAGRLIKEWGPVVGILAGLWYLVTHWRTA